MSLKFDISGPFEALANVGVAVFKRRLTINVENLASDGASFEFGGEWFDSGGWQEQRVERIGEHAELDFENKVLLKGLSGYVYYHTADHSQTLVMAFCSPVATACCFTARAGKILPDCRALWSRVPDISRPGAGLRRADGCAWETLELQDEHVVIRCIILPVGSNARVSEQLACRLNKARWCRSTLEDSTMVDSSRPTLIERQVVLEIDNRSGETFVLDGEWFASGGWGLRPCDILPPASVARVEFTSDEVFSGVRGLVWYVNERSHDTYVSIVFNNPVTGVGAFNAWAGPPPAELLQELYVCGSIAEQEGIQVPSGRGVAWNIMSRGAVLEIRIVILDGLAPMDLLAFPPKLPADAPAQAPEVLPPEPSTCQAIVPLIKEDAVAAAGDDVDSIETFFSQTWNQTRPRDVMDGLGRGLKIAGGSIVASTASLTAMPYFRAQEDIANGGSGVGGFMKGLGWGVLGAVVGTCAGVVGCCTMVGRGLANTPEALQRAFDQDEKRWDSELGAWVDDHCNLRLEADDVAAEGSDSEASDDEGVGLDADGRPVKVADKEYYDVIGVAPNASSMEIKRAYYKMAIKVHPDKNPDDPAAAQRFQQLSTAYQVLSDPKLRERYDQLGKAAVSESALPSVDPALFFSMLFGSEQFEKYIGKLWMAMQTDQIAKGLQKDLDKYRTDEGPDGASADKVLGGALEREMRWSADGKKDKWMQRQQFLRLVRCAVTLRDRLSLWVADRDEPGFMAQISQEAQELTRVSFGGRLLRTIGDIYEAKAEEFFAAMRGNFTIDAQLASWRDSIHATKVKVQAVSSVAKSAMVMKKMHDAAGASVDEDQEKKEEATRKIWASFEDSLPVFLQTIWDISASDIENTVRRVCDKILKDKSVPWQLRFRRAKALSRLGTCFRDAGQAERTDLTEAQNAKQHLEEALCRAMNEKGQ